MCRLRRQGNQHSAKYFAVDVAGIRTQNTDQYLFFCCQRRDDRLFHHGAVEGQAGYRPIPMGQRQSFVGTDQMPAGRGAGIGKYILHSTDFGHRAPVQDGHPVTDLFDDGHLVGNENHGDAPLFVDLLQQCQDAFRGLGVQSRGGLVTQQHLRLGSQGPGNGNALLLSAGKLHGVGIRLVRQTYGFQQLPGSFLRRFALHPGKLHGKADVFQSGALLQQVEALKDHGNFAPLLP